MIYYCSKFYHLELWWMGKSTDRREMFTIPHFISFVQYNIFNFSLLYFDIKKTLITKSVKNHSFLLSLNWTVSGIYGDQCCSLIEILSPWFFYLSQTYTSHISFLTTSKLITILANSVKYVKFVWFKRFFLRAKRNTMLF